MAINRESVLEQARLWAQTGPNQPRMRWSPVHFGNYDGDDVAQWVFNRPASEPLPAPTDTTSVSCFAIFLLAMAHVADDALAIRGPLRQLYTDSFRRYSELEDDVWAVLLAKDEALHPFDPLAGALPQPGQLLFLNGSSHVMMMNGLRAGPERAYASRIEVLSFYGNYPHIPADTRTPTPLAIATLAQVRDYYAELGAFSQRRAQRPVTPVDVTIEYADPIWA